MLGALGPLKLPLHEKKSRKAFHDKKEDKGRKRSSYLISISWRF